MARQLHSVAFAVHKRTAVEQGGPVDLGCTTVAEFAAVDQETFPAVSAFALADFHKAFVAFEWVVAAK